MEITFKRLEKQFGAVSSEGFSVLRGGSPITQFFLEYKENDHVYRFYLENLMPGSDHIIYLTDIANWEEPYKTETIEIDKRRLIGERIVSAMQFLGNPKYSLAEEILATFNEIGRRQFRRAREEKRKTGGKKRTLR